MERTPAGATESKSNQTATDSRPDRIRHNTSTSTRAAHRTSHMSPAKADGQAGQTLGLRYGAARDDDIPPVPKENTDKQTSEASKERQKKGTPTGQQQPIHSKGEHRRRERDRASGESVRWRASRREREGMSARPSMAGHGREGTLGQMGQ